MAQPVVSSVQAPALRPPVPQPSPVLRKARAAIGQLPRMLARQFAGADSFAAHPPILVNSLPKSGTHLMMQIAEALPGARQYGSFIAQRPSWAAWTRDTAQIEARIARIAPGEVLGAHLHHSPRIARALARRNVLHLFIYRDPRAVLVSEVQYLAQVARWNALHKRFAEARDFNAQIDLAIAGDGSAALPDMALRYGPYLAWVDAPGVLAVRYEDLICPKRRPLVLRDVLARHGERCGLSHDPRHLARLAEAILPEQSHTYTGRDPERWRRKLSPVQEGRVCARFPWLA